MPMWNARGSRRSSPLPRRGPDPEPTTAYERYHPIVDGHDDAITSLFASLGVGATGLLDQKELARLVAAYQGEASFDAASFFGWFDANGVRAASKPDGMLDLDEFGWYLAHLAAGFGDHRAARSAMPELISTFRFLGEMAHAPEVPQTRSSYVSDESSAGSSYPPQPVAVGAGKPRTTKKRAGAKGSGPKSQALRFSPESLSGASLYSQ